MRERFERMVREAQDAICAGIEAFEPTARFRRDGWQRDGGGGGESRVLQEGAVFEKAGVNFSSVFGELPAAAVRSMGGGDRLGDDASGQLPFFAAGVSVVIHAHSPMVPTVHCNYRYFELEKPSGEKVWWFGGGADLTPSYLFEEDARHFHQVHREACDRFDPDYYPRFKVWCDEYFHIAHRGEARGVGGIFFDNLGDGDPEALFGFSSACAAAFVPAYAPIVERRKEAPFEPRHKRWQQLRRGRYVEFNLVYDRGTTFGLKTKGRTESILMSLPLTARWEYDHQPPPDSDEARLLAVLASPRDWLA
ncbi:MAG: oxygen-dependent coproporphyrinogen oxidase [Myxococcales bacterium]|nr:oxygen-dependent coproporphyrinogen oxidase [Myxococcales bacterium]